jgi:hypothetical protein
LLQSFEQQSPFAAHGLPDVLQIGLSATHFESVHLPPQHSPSVVQAALSATHCLPEHLPPTHENVQHWLFVVHAASGKTQAVVDVVHVFDVASQLAVQQSALDAHESPACLHEPPSPFDEVPSGPPSVAAWGELESLPHPAKVLTNATESGTARPATKVAMPMLLMRERLPRERGSSPIPALVEWKIWRSPSHDSATTQSGHARDQARRY